MAATSVATSVATAGAPTPPAVLHTLSAAFGGDLIGETGYEIAAATCTSAAEKAEAKRRGSSLLYGELLPDGVTKALTRSRLGGALPQVPARAELGGAVVLELGSGSGKVAMQVFLQCPEVAHVLGVELVPSRYDIGAAALRRLVSLRPGAYREVGPSAVPKATPSGEAACLEEISAGRKLEFCCADFFSLGLDLAARSDIIFFAVHIPCKLFPQLCETLATAKEGCRLFTYHALDTIWWSDLPCPFRQCEDNVQESDTFSTSWSPQGYRFYVYVCDRRQEVPQIQGGIRNETFSEWQPMWDEASQGYYFHNNETEESQWEVPTRAGCWRVEWSAEHNASFYWHEPTSHAQWEVPKCLEDLGWGTST